MSGILNSGKIQTLLDRLTQPLADQIADNLDAEVSSRLSANDSRLDRLDASISEIKGAIQIEEVAASGSVTAPEGATWARVVIVGAGGGGVGAGGADGYNGGGGGEIIETTVDVVGGVSYPVTIGAGGASGADGGDTTAFGVTATGGLGGTETGPSNQSVDSQAFFERWGRTSGGIGSAAGTPSRGGDSRTKGGTPNGTDGGGGGGSYGRGGTPGGAAPEKGGGGAGEYGALNNQQDGAPGYVRIEWVS